MSARPALERALTLDPNYRSPLHMLHVLSLYERRYAEANALARRAYSPDGPLSYNLTSARAVSAFAGNDTAAQRAVVAELGGAGEFVIFQSAAFVASYTDNLVGARRIAELMIESSTRSQAARARGHVMLGLIEIARGAPDSARWEFARAAALDPSLALTYEGVVAAVPQFGFTRDEIRATDVST